MVSPTVAALWSGGALVVLVFCILAVRRSRVVRFRQHVRTVRRERIAYLEMRASVLDRQVVNFGRFPEIQAASQIDLARVRRELEGLNTIEEEKFYEVFAAALNLRLEELARCERDLRLQKASLKRLQYEHCSLLTARKPRPDLKSVSEALTVRMREREAMIRKIESRIAHLNSPSLGLDWSQVSAD